MNDPAFPDALPALSRLHWYVIERVLGQGGFGITYLARDTNLDQRVAIKEYLPVEFATRMPDATVRPRTDDLRDRYRWGLERFILEARTLARFDHPSIVRVHSVFEFNNTAYMVMRFEEGINLAALLDRRGTLPEDELLRILLPILDGLELVHSAGFIHRDIKPDNVHIADDGRAVLLDFGSARQALGNAHTLTILVAPGYAPFEQYYSDSGNQGPWTDIYALGATCYRAIAGRAPLDAVSRSKGILGSTQEILVPASVIGAGRYSGRLLAAIDHALQFAEKDRPQTIAEWRQELVSGRAATAATSTAAGTAFAYRPATAAPPKMPSGVAWKDVAAASEAISPQMPEAPAANRRQLPGGSRSRRLTTIAILVVAILAIGVLAYVFTAGRTDETRLKIAALEKQIRDKELADADRDRAAKQQLENEARQRREQEQQAQAALEKSRTELTAKRETAERPRAVERKQLDEAAKRPPPAARAAPIASSPAPAAPARGTEPTPARLPVERPSAGAASQLPAGQPSTGAASQPPAGQPPTGAASQPAVVQTSTGRASPPAAIPVEAATSTAAGTLADKFADAERAMAAKRYTDAVAIVRPLAEAGSARAQAMLGDAYAEGRGVAREERAAGSWYEKAALQGETSAQFKLAAMYAKGIGVTRNNNLAYVWYGTAARLGSNPAKLEQERIAALLQPAEREQADRLIESSVARMAKRP